MAKGMFQVFGATESQRAEIAAVLADELSGYRAAMVGGWFSPAMVDGYKQLVDRANEFGITLNELIA